MLCISHIEGRKEREKEKGREEGKEKRKEGRQGRKRGSIDQINERHTCMSCELG